MTNPETTRVSQQEITDILWRACDTFRGTVDPSQYKDYLLVMLFLKYVSDTWADKRDDYKRKYKGDSIRVERALARERFVVPPKSEFGWLYEHRDASNLGELINQALEAIEDANRGKLENVFRNIDYNSEPNLGETRERNRRLRNLLDDFANPKLDMRPSHVGHMDVIGHAYEYLIGRFASGAGKKGGEFYTPPEVATLLAKLLAPKPGETIYDPACGSGSLLIRMAREVGGDNYSLFGQEVNGQTWALCKMNMFLHDIDSARIEWGDTLNAPKLIEGSSIRRFDVVVANPPFSLDKWGAEKALDDRYGRFHRGTPPKSKADYAFISHMIESALETGGRVGVIVPHGVLFRGGAEGKIRQKLIEENLLDSVVGLPANLFFGTGIPAAILIFRKGRVRQTTLFIDASNGFTKDKKRSVLRQEDVARIVEAFQSDRDIERLSRHVSPADLRDAGFNLNVARYVDPSEAEGSEDLPDLQRRISDLEKQLGDSQREVQRILSALGYEPLA